MDEMKESPKTTVNLHIPKESNIDVDVGSLKIGKGQMVRLEGKITSVSQDEYGKGFSMEITSVSFGGNSSMKDEAEEMRRRRTIKG